MTNQLTPTEQHAMATGEPMPKANFEVWRDGLTVDWLVDLFDDILDVCCRHCPASERCADIGKSCGQEIRDWAIQEATYAADN